MKLALIPQLSMCGLMLLSAGLAQHLTPTVKMAESRPEMVLSHVIPSHFGDWTEEAAGASMVIDPQLQEQISRIYTQVLSRTYVNSAGERIMLSIAYGRDQSDTTQVHYPEVCYPAQGFQVMSSHEEMLATGRGAIQVKRLETNQDSRRYEPVTYWTTVGDMVVTNRLDKKVAELKYGFNGEIPDGLLFRVSSINRDTGAAFRLQDGFVQSLQMVLHGSDKLRLMGLRD